MPPFLSLSMGSTSAFPGAVRYINDVGTQLALPSGDARLLEASGVKRCGEMSSMFSCQKSGQRGPRAEGL